MIRLILREAFLTLALLFVASLVGFLVLDRTGRHDWYGVLAAARRAGVPDDRALARQLPLVWNSRVEDAQVRTQNDLLQLESPHTRAAATASLLRRGTAALPTILSELHQLSPEVQLVAVQILAQMTASAPGVERPPTELQPALQYWDRFDALRSLDFRHAYAHRLVQRLVEHESENAAEQLTRLGSFAFPAIFDVLDEPIDTDSARRLTDQLAEMTGKPLRLAADASVADTRNLVDAWRAWWFAEHLDYDHFSDTSRSFGHVTETRYGRWLARALSGRLGVTIATTRPIQAEIRQRLPASLFVGGLGGLIATAIIVAFGGGSVLRRRPLRTKLVDLAGALVPGLTAFLFAFIALAEVCSAPHPAGPLLRHVLAPWHRLAFAVTLLTILASLWLRRRSSRVLLHAVRREAENWALESRHPRIGQMLRHGFRVGVASLFAPLGLSAIALLGMTLLIEPLAGVEGMGDLTLRSLRHWDAPWLLVAIISAVPLAMGGRWARRVLVWALGDPSARPPPPMSIMPPPMQRDRIEKLTRPSRAGSR